MSIVSININLGSSVKPEFADRKFFADVYRISLDNRANGCETKSFY